jgi:hypothetical protein
MKNEGVLALLVELPNNRSFVRNDASSRYKTSLQVEW